MGVDVEFVDTGDVVWKDTTDVHWKLVPLGMSVYDSGEVAESIGRMCKFNINVHDCGETADKVGG